jgi:hypothetical protein
MENRLETRGGLDITTLKIGDITYEYRQLINSHFEDFVQYKLYNVCIVSVVISLLEPKPGGYWEWESERLIDNRVITYRVYEGTTQGSPYLFNFKRWDAKKFT